jgi:hypothetical protein
MFEEGTSQTAARQTMSSWTRVIESPDQVPHGFQGFFDSLPAAEHPFPYSLFAPPLDRFLHRTPEKMICDANGAWHVMEHAGNQLMVKSYPLQNIYNVEMGRILLRSWITISGLPEDGKATSSTIEFNSATARHYTHFLSQFRPAPLHMDEDILHLELEKFNYLASVSFKFMNFARSSLTGGEKVIDSVWQPEIRERGLPLHGWPFYRTISTAHLMILTDKEVILLREDGRSRPNKGVRYGGARRYIPLRSIQSVAIAKQDENLLVFCLHLRHHLHLEWLFDVSLKSQLEQFKEELEILIA